jgi:UDP-glucose 4-epimerase
LFKKVIVTGAAGFIGSTLCQRLMNLGVEEIVGIDNLRSGDWSRVPTGVIRVNRDLNDISKNEWLDFFKNTDILFHLAAEKYNSSKSTPEKLLTTNINATELMFRSAAESRVRRTVFTSSLYAYGSMGPEIMQEEQVPTPNTLYGASKLMGEGILKSIDRSHELSWNVARLFFIYGPRQYADGGYKSVITTNFERIIKGEPPVICGSGSQSLDYVYIDDCIDALLCLSSSSEDRRIVNVSSGQSISINQLTALMLETAKAQIIPEHSKPDWTEGSSRFGDNTLIKSLFNWEPRTTIQSGISEVFNWMKLDKPK